MNKSIVGIAKMIILRRDTSDAGATVLKSDYLKGRAAEGDYILEQLRVFSQMKSPKQNQKFMEIQTNDNITVFLCALL